MSQNQHQQQIKILIEVIDKLTSKIAIIKSGKICLRCEGTGIVQVGEKDCAVCSGTGRHFLCVDDYADCSARTRAPPENMRNAPDALPSLPPTVAALPYSQQLAALLSQIDMLHQHVNNLVVRRVCFQCEGNGATKFNRACRVCENQCGWVTKSNDDVLDQIYGTNRKIAAKTQTDSKPCCFCIIQ